MDLSSLIFVALFVAWAVYLVPKALRHHEEDAVSRSVDGFSDRLRVLARREAVSSTEAELVAPGAPARSSEKPAAEPTEEVSAAPTPAPRASSRRGASAAARRRRVLSVLVLANAVAGSLAAGAVTSAWWIAAPASLLVAWLVACRLMVRRERAARAAAARRRRRTSADEVLEAEADEAVVEPEVAAAEVGADLADLADDDTGEIPAVSAELLEESAVDGWAPVSVPLPTYVAKAPAGRTVRTIDLDSTGVWSSGRNDADSQLAREADAQRASSAAADDDAQERRTGS
ncbi:hypothetical protein GCM10022237_34030 [Nocardioides ginsengisoli]|uniref:Uncharacterized protein n=1 Tax=Nocardioides ginsengisoli TaxID=363868 RepID=A0ABW3VVX1_9ACTN